jgi:uncharacterized membrane protein YphA (DoxX/SURF4 family)
MKQKILTALSVLFGLMMANSGFNKFFNYMPMPDNFSEAMMKDFGALQEISWLMPLVAVAEIVGGLLLFLPKTRALGAIVLFPVMVGILLVHALVEPSGLVMVIVLWAILAWIIYENKEKYMPMIQG